MRLKSKGLGRKELVMDFREYAVVREGEEIVVKGTIRDPVVWDFSIRICEDDLGGIARLAGSWAILGLLLRALFKRNRHHHWSGDRAAHVAGTRHRRAEAQAKFGAGASGPQPRGAVQGGAAGADHGDARRVAEGS
jgi:hypothetical protein